MTFSTCVVMCPPGPTTLLTIVSPPRGSRRDRASGRPGHAAAGPGAPADPGPRDLGGRPPHRAARPLRGPPAGVAAGRRPPRGRGRRRHPVLASSRGSDYPNVGLNAVVGRPRARVEHGAGPLRRDAPGLLRHRRPGRRHGPGRHLGLAVLPLAGRRVLRRRLLAGRRQGAGPGLPAGLERLAPRGVGRDPPRAHHPAAAALAGRRGRWPRPRCGPTRHAGFKAVSFPEFPAQLRLPLHLQRPLGPLLRRLRGDRHRGVPPHRGVGLGPAALARPALRAAAHRVPGQRAAGRRPNGCGPAWPCASRGCRWPCPRAASAGCPC